MLSAAGPVTTPRNAGRPNGFRDFVNGCHRWSVLAHWDNYRRRWHKIRGKNPRRYSVSQVAVEEVWEELEVRKMIFLLSAIQWL